MEYRNIHVMLNSKRYPELDYNLSFPAYKFSRAYGDAAEFRTKFFSMDELISNPNITPSDYQNLFSFIFVRRFQTKQKTKIFYYPYPN